MTSSVNEFDVAVVGGGLTGVAFAGLLAGAAKAAGAGLRIALVEAQPPIAVPADAELDLRVSAIAPTSQAVLQTLGIWQQLGPRRASPYRRMCVWQGAGGVDGGRSIRFDAAELGTPELGHIVENRAIRQAGWDILSADSSVTLVTGASPARLEIDSDAALLELESGEVLRASLIVGADGGKSWVRNQLNIAYRERDYGQAAIVAHVTTEEPHNETAWQRFVPGGPVALLPLATGQSSLVWSCPTERAHELLETDADNFAKELGVVLDHVLGEVQQVSARASFPLGLGYASRYCGERFALIGDAAHRVHPLAGQGANLGLLDAAVLAEELTAHISRRAADLGDPMVLRRYERARKGDNLVTMSTMDMLNRLFSSVPNNLLADLGGRSLGMVDDLGPLKYRLARYAMGVDRDLPAAARPWQESSES